MSIKDVRDKIKLGLSQIKGLTVHKEPPNNLAKFPCFVLDWAEPAADYLTRPGNTCHWFFRGILILSERTSETAYASLDDYIDKTGDNSIKENIEGQDVGDWVVVTSCERTGIIDFMGTEIYGAEFVIDVADTT